MSSPGYDSSKMLSPRPGIEQELTDQEGVVILVITAAVGVQTRCMAGLLTRDIMLTHVRSGSRERA